jgi:hypothetical protein
VNRRIVWAFLFAFALFASLVSCIHSVNAESADRIHFSFGVTLFSPIDRTYNSSFLTLNFSFACGLGMRYSLNYYIDGEYGGPMPYVIKNPEELHVIYYATGLVELPELSEGSHRLTVNLLVSPSSNHIKPSYVDTVYFSIDLTPPNISILSPLNETYAAANVTAANIPLDFVVSENVSQVTYSLDGQNDTLIAGNTTLTELSIGSHNVTLYARDVAGNTGTSETIYFTIAPKEEPRTETEQEQFPTAPVAAASAATVAVASLGLLVYFKKRNQ